jgi:GTP-binding protein
MSKPLPVIAIVGKANVGKSSLFNSILDRREAIVAREAGTTRDSITARTSWKGQDFWLVDTAGLKDPEDDFEITIQEQILQAVDSADVIWLVVEANKPITEEERKLAKTLLKSKKEVFLILNKVDRARGDLSDFKRFGIKAVFPTSTTQQRGIDNLLDDLIKHIPKVRSKDNGDRIGIAVIGRPNVGKSMLFNSLSKKQQAVVTSRAGTTRDVNRNIVKYKGKSIELMDTAGIRRSGKIEQGIESFSVLRTLAAIEQSDICLLVMSVEELNVALEQKIAGMVKASGKGLILVVSKWDTLENKTTEDQGIISSRIANNYEFVPWAPLVFTSGLTGQNVTKLFELALEINDRRAKKISTSELNKWLKTTVAKHPPAGLRNRSPKLNYMVQESNSACPSFKVFGSNTKFVHWSYRRFLEHQFRDLYDFIGTPVQLWLIEKHVGHKHGQIDSKE